MESCQNHSVSIIDITTECQIYEKRYTYHQIVLSNSKIIQVNQAGNGEYTAGKNQRYSFCPTGTKRTGKMQKRENNADGNNHLYAFTSPEVHALTIYEIQEYHRQAHDTPPVLS